MKGCHGDEGNDNNNVDVSKGWREGQKKKNPFMQEAKLGYPHVTSSYISDMEDLKKKEVGWTDTHTHN